MSRVWSYGIALCNSRNCILYIKKRHTYAFLDFVRGRYKKTLPKGIVRMFNQMTSQEKFIILQGFDSMWSYVYKPYEIPSQNSDIFSVKSYYRCKRIYEHVFRKHGRRLVNIINRSTNSDTLWEIPKGRSKDGEKPLDAAIREMAEETGVTIEHYEIIFKLRPIKITYEDNRIKYGEKYYIAFLQTEPKCVFQCRDSVNMEMDGMRWMSGQDYSNSVHHGSLNYNRMMTINNHVKKISKVLNAYHTLSS